MIGQSAIGSKCASPARLQPVGNTLFIANEENGGRRVLGTPMFNGLGEIQQGFLEQSNVDFEKELEEIEELTMILKTPGCPCRIHRPATGQQPSTRTHTLMSTEVWTDQGLRAGRGE